MCACEGAECTRHAIEDVLYGKGAQGKDLCIYAQLNACLVTFNTFSGVLKVPCITNYHL